MQRIVINVQFGGFSLSKEATALWAKLNGRECYFFENARKPGGGIDLRRYAPLSAGAETSLFWWAFDIPNPNDVVCGNNEAYARHSINARSIERTDPTLLRVIEELGSERASGKCATLKIVEIPDGVQWEIDEYDGNETVREVHRSWS